MHFRHLVTFEFDIKLLRRRSEGLDGCLKLGSPLDKVLLVFFSFCLNVALEIPVVFQALCLFLLLRLQQKVLGLLQIFLNDWLHPVKIVPERFFDVLKIQAGSVKRSKVFEAHRLDSLVSHQH